MNPDQYSLDRYEGNWDLQRAFDHGYSDGAEHGHRLESYSATNHLDFFLWHIAKANSLSEFHHLAYREGGGYDEIYSPSETYFSKAEREYYHEGDVIPEVPFTAVLSGEQEAYVGGYVAGFISAEEDTKWLTKYKHSHIPPLWPFIDTARKRGSHCSPKLELEFYDAGKRAGVNFYQFLQGSDILTKMIDCIRETASALDAWPFIAVILHRDILALPIGHPAFGDSYYAGVAAGVSKCFIQEMERARQSEEKVADSTNIDNSSL